MDSHAAASSHTERRMAQPFKKRATSRNHRFAKHLPTAGALSGWNFWPGVADRHMDCSLGPWPSDISSVVWSGRLSPPPPGLALLQLLSERPTVIVCLSLMGDHFPCNGLIVLACPSPIRFNLLPSCIDSGRHWPCALCRPKLT